MHHRLLTHTLLGLLLAGVAHAQQTDQPTKAARIAFENPAWDFGSIKQGADANHTFVYRNEGTLPLVVTEARSSCGCTVPSWTREPVGPGGTGEIKVTFKSRGRRGKQHKTVTVRSNDPGQPVLYLTVSGDIEVPPAGEIQYSPTRIDFGLLEKDSRLEDEVIIRNTGKMPLLIQGVSGAPPELNAHLDGETTLPPGAQARVVVTLAHGPRTLPGYYERTITIRSNDPIRPATRVPCVAYVRGDRGGRLVTLQGEIDVGAIERPDQPLVSIPLLNTGDTPVTVERAQVAGTALTVTVPEGLVVEPGKTAYVSVRSSDRLRRGTFRDRVMFYTSAGMNPRSPSHTVNFSGYVAVDHWPGAAEGANRQGNN